MAGTEKVEHVISSLTKTRWLVLIDNYTLVVTGKRAIIAKIENSDIRKAVDDANRKAKEQGKGFFARMGAQLSASYNYSQRYYGMNPDDIAKESPANISIPLDQIQKVKARFSTYYDSNDQSRQEGKVTIKTISGKFVFKTKADPRDAIKKAFPGKV